jgi:hypothetical protein
MSDRPRTGDVLCSGVSTARFLVLDGGSAAHLPRLGGAAMVRGRRRPCSEPVSGGDQCDLQGGRRYVDPATGLTLFCIQPGDGALYYEDRPIAHRPIQLMTLRDRRSLNAASVSPRLV